MSKNRQQFNSRRKPWLSLVAIFVDFQRPYLRFQSRPWYPQLDRSARGSEYPAATFFQGALNHVLLLLLESLRELNLVFRFCCSKCLRLLWQPAFIDRENLCFAEYHRTLDDVLQFANVSRPRI